MAEIHGLLFCELFQLLGLLLKERSDTEEGNRFIIALSFIFCIDNNYA